jgi:integrase
MAKRRGHGEGSIYLRDDGRWSASISLENCKRKTLYGKTRKEVQEKLKRALPEQQQGILQVGVAPKLSDYAPNWLESYQRCVRPNTHQRVCEVFHLHVLPTLGHIRLDKLTPQYLDQLYKEKLKENLSPTTVALIHTVIHKALDHAVKQGIIHLNVSDRVEPPRQEEYEARVFTEEELEQFLIAIRGHPLFLLLLMDVSTGMRRGEIAGLKWSDVDRKKGIVRLQRAIVRQPKQLGGGYAEAPLKTKKSRRSIVLPEYVRRLLEQYYAEQEVMVQENNRSKQFSQLSKQRGYRILTSLFIQLLMTVETAVMDHTFNIYTFAPGSDAADPNARLHSAHGDVRHPTSDQFPGRV